MYKKFAQSLTGLFLLFMIVFWLVVAGWCVYLTCFSVTVDPAIAALTEAKYTNIHFIGDRKGVCGLEPDFIHALISTDSIPKIERKDSFDKSCFFGDKWIGKDINGLIETGNIYCGPLARLHPPFKDCDIYDDSSVPDETDNEERQ